ncbi:chromosome segregation ATPase [Chitinivorax tropicus]|uniref:Chromosome segregation ATPase n=1 Tax=Chitinivorax tropicus TaxID=714531 RepID=A0A840MGR2_9PROT|nr:ATP-binding protein [Chitinivorax tropicus]MBB5017838.1 chromosome segregation ATPase [Chitinivorax tropicus]
MFHFRKLEVMHWDFWQRFSLPLDAQIITIIGPNGSGKTTLLDGFRTLLALKCSGKRDYKRYVRNAKEPVAWLRGIVDNERSASGRYPFFPFLDQQITLACRIKKQGGDWSRQYAICEGDVSIEEIEARGQWLGVNDYRRRLESAGLTPAIAEVLALEQGDTDKLCEYSPRALLDLVFQVFGEKEVLDNYQQAKQEQKQAERELEELDGRLAKLSATLESLTGKANRYLEWQHLQTERESLQTETLPRLELHELIVAMLNARQQNLGARRNLRERHYALEDCQQKLHDIEQQLHDAGPALTKAKLAQTEANNTFMKLREEIRGFEAKLSEQTKLQEMARAQGGDLTAEIDELGQKRTEFASLHADLKRLKKERDDTQALANALRGGQQPSFAFVDRFRAALDEAGIRHEMLADIVEVADPTWQGAVEAMMAPFKHVVLLKRPEDKARAWALGEKLQYRHFVVAERQHPPRAERGSVLEVVRFNSDAPDWLMRQLNRVQRVEDAAAGARLGNDTEWITREGFHRERRGGRFIGVAAHEYHFGEAARKSRRAALEEERARLDAQIEQLEHRMEPLANRIGILQAKVAGVDAANMLAARADEFKLAHDSLQIHKEKALQASDQLIAANQAFEQAQAHRGKLEVRQSQQIDRAQQMRVEVERLRGAGVAHRREQVARYEAIRAMRTRLPAEWVARHGLKQLKATWETLGAVRRRMDEIDRRFEQEAWETDDSVIERRDKLQADFNALEFQTAARQREFDRAGQLCDDARGAYINVLRNTVRRYAKNIRALGELAGIEVHADMPHLENDDIVLAQAGLTVQFNFDRKGMMGLNDGEASGGQQVMKSLILLIGMMMDDARPGGFVFIDEPFAHLDIFNIDKVASFLKSTQAQYLITSPTTHNVNVFEPSELTLVTRKKQPGEGYAQPIMVTVRERPAGGT